MLIKAKIICSSFCEHSYPPVEKAVNNFFIRFNKKILHKDKHFFSTNLQVVNSFSTIVEKAFILLSQKDLKRIISCGKLIKSDLFHRKFKQNLLSKWITEKVIKNNPTVENFFKSC